jgi:hypothetical protein
MEGTDIKQVRGTCIRDIHTYLHTYVEGTDIKQVCGTCIHDMHTYTCVEGIDMKHVCETHAYATCMHV